MSKRAVCPFCQAQVCRCGISTSALRKHADGMEKRAARLEALERVAVAARKLKAARDERHKRARDLQAAAALARAGGPRGSAALAEFDRTHLTVWDIGDVTEEICEALAALDGTP